MRGGESGGQESRGPTSKSSAMEPACSKNRIRLKKEFPLQRKKKASKNEFGHHCMDGRKGARVYEGSARASARDDPHSRAYIRPRASCLEAWIDDCWQQLVHVKPRELADCINRCTSKKITTIPLQPQAYRMYRRVPP